MNRIILTLIAAIGQGTSAFAQNIIDQTHGPGAGSFELGAFVDGGGDAGGSTNYMGLRPGNTTITGWTVGGPGDGVDWLSKPFFGTSDGIRAVDLKHLQNSSISTTVPTVAGENYTLTFDAAAPITSLGSMENMGKVSAGSLVDQSFTVPRTQADWSAQTFTKFSFSFTATAAQTTVTFTATSNISPTAFTYGPAIDRVSVQKSSVSQGLPVAASIATAVEIVWSTTAGKNYQVQTSSSLENSNWVDFGEPVTGDDTEKSVFDTTRSAARRFYRVIEIP